MKPEDTVSLGLDGKGEHHACALDPSGEKLHDKPLPDDEQRLRALFTQLGRHGRVPVVVDQPAPRSALCRSRSPAPRAARSPTCLA
jgi:Transposase